MADVLGKYSFLETPDVNGTDVLLNAGGVPSISLGPTSSIPAPGVVGRLFVDTTLNAVYRDTGTTWQLTTIPPDVILPGTGAVTLPIGTTAQRPGTPTDGMFRYNSTFGNAEYYSQTAWRPVGQVVQIVTGTIAQNSSNVQIPYDTTTPLNTEGFQLWTQSFTPLYANSLIVIQSNQWTVVNSAADVVVVGALFNGATCITAQMISWSTNTNAGSSSLVYFAESAVSTAARTYSLRAGPNVAVTVFYNRGVTATLGGIGTGQYTITEIAQ